MPNGSPSLSGKSGEFSGGDRVRAILQSTWQPELDINISYEPTMHWFVLQENGLENPTKLKGRSLGSCSQRCHLLASWPRSRPICFGASVALSALECYFKDQMLNISTLKTVKHTENMSTERKLSQSELQIMPGRRKRCYWPLTHSLNHRIWKDLSDYLV